MWSDWYPGYDGENPTKILQKVSQSARVMMDRWKIEFSKPEEGDEEEEGDPIPCNIINNYFSIGVVSETVLPDCKCCLSFGVILKK